MFFYTCGVNQFCIIVFFAAVKHANNILFCIELIQRPESSNSNIFLTQFLKVELNFYFDGLP